MLKDQEIKKIHMIAVCGTGMGSLALMLQASDFEVTGSDAHIYPPMSDLLRNAGIHIYEGFDPAHLEGADLVIIGNAVSKSNREVQEVLGQGLSYLSFPQALSQFFLEGRSSIVVAGTHGKTTTSSLMAWVLASAGRDPGFLIGGWPKNFKGGAEVGGGPYFVVEGDEYDTAFFDKGPKFLHYRPKYAILTGIEFDHGDIYQDLHQIKTAFRAFVEQLPEDGLLVAAGGDPNVDAVLDGACCQVLRYGLREPSASPLAGWSAEMLEVGPGGTTLEVFFQGERWGSVQCPLMGRHNTLNTLSVIAIAHHLGLSMEEIAEGLASFQGVKRRQEVRGEVRDIIVMDDFAHHPTAVRETLYALRAGFPNRRLWAVFEPRSATSRSKTFQQDFIEAFQDADHVVIADVFASDKIPSQERLDPGQLVEEMKLKGQDAMFFSSTEEILKGILPRLKPGDLVCVMSSGAFDGLHERLLDALRDPSE